MTTIHVEPYLSKELAVTRAVEKIESNPINKPFLFTGAIYSKKTGASYVLRIRLALER